MIQFMQETMDQEASSPADDRCAASLESWLRQRIAQVSPEWERAGEAAARWSWARLGMFFLAIAGLYPLRHQPIAAAVFLALAVAGFILIVRRHNRVRQRHESLGWLLRVLEESLRRCGGPIALIRHNARPEDALDGTGETTPNLAFPVGRHREPVPHVHAYRLTDQERDDLDLYAQPVGLFGLLNRASSRIGELRLRDWLESPLLEKPALLRRQGAVRYLAQRAELRYAMLGALAGLRGLDAQVALLLRAMDTAESVLRPGVSLGLRLWSLVSFGLFIWGLVQLFAGDWRIGLLVLGFLSVLNMALLSRFWPAVRRLLRGWSRSIDASSEYALIARQIVRELPEEAPVPEVRQAMERVCQRHSLPAALRWMNWATSGGALHMLLNLYAFYDLHMLEGIYRHVLPNRAALIRGLTVLADLEAMLSLASFSAEQPRRCWPEPVEGRSLSIAGGAHPLIDPSRSVANDLRLDARQNLWIITGSNMSGKSTFLRMTGVNLLLAQIGCAASAGQMRFSPLRLITDLRIRDNLAKGESYFLAEVRQLRRMIVPEPEQDAPVPILGLIDEPFRGTNHQEQRAATLAVIEHLSRSDGLHLIATHDRTVAGIAGSAGAQNYHFQEHLQGKELSFDYLLRPGAAQTRNALRVLERENYPPDLIARANAWVDDPQAKG